MKHISKAHSFVSTWSLESWGITALESLSHGIPTILLTDSSDKHASEAIAADSSHIIKLKKSSTVEEVEEAINLFKNLSHGDRLAISKATREKHSKDKWIADMNQLFNGVEVGKGYNPFRSELFSF
jgi:UDP:flavonoid glycosyltransferase YjiC (YdhE family)